MKKGFTLIELMAVIIIIGVLAAIGAPKLFGLAAKAKASEIQPAAGTYIHLQEAYTSSGKTTFGNWEDIGYKAPGDGKGESRNFCYSQGTLTTSIEIASNEDGIIGWGATNKSQLKDCLANSWWSITTSGTEKGAITYNQYVSSGECQALLANWESGATLEGDCENATVASNESTITPDTKPGTETESSTGDKDKTEQEDYNLDNLVWNSANLEKNYTIINGEYVACDNGSNWLQGEIVGQTNCKTLRNLLYENNDLVHPKNGSGKKEQENSYVFNGEASYCLVTKDCSDEAYAAALNARREELKQAEDAQKQEAGGSGSGTGNEGNSNSNLDDTDNNQGNNGNQNGNDGDDGDVVDEPGPEELVPQKCVNNKGKECKCGTGNCHPVS